MISHHINVVQGLRIRNATARRCTSTVSGFEDINYRVSARNRKERIPIYDLQLLNGNGPQNSGEINETLDMSEGDGEQPPELFISESFLCAERVINTVVESVLKKRWQDYKFMGVTSSEVCRIFCVEHFLEQSIYHFRPMLWTSKTVWPPCLWPG